MCSNNWDAMDSPAPWPVMAMPYGTASYPREHALYILILRMPYVDLSKMIIHSCSDADATDLAKFVTDWTGILPILRTATLGMAPGIESAVVHDLKMPFGRGRKAEGCDICMYDGFRVQEISQCLAGDPDGSVLHIFVTDLLVGTFDYADYRYHARAVVCSNPAVISIPGIVEAPSRPREYYLDTLLRPKGEAARRHAGTFLEHGDPLLPDAIRVYLMQAIAYYATGEAFCSDRSCCMYNAHWQEELLRQMRSPGMCAKHAEAVSRMRGSAE